MNVLVTNHQDKKNKKLQIKFKNILVTKIEY